MHLIPHRWMTTAGGAFVVNQPGRILTEITAWQNTAEAVAAGWGQEEPVWLAESVPVTRATHLVSQEKGLVPRPLKSSEFAVEHVTSQAATGWRDILAAQKNAAADARGRLAKAPHHSDPKCHQPKGQLATSVRDGIIHDQWQYELTGGARMWFYVEGRTVKIANVFTNHPNQTK